MKKLIYLAALPAALLLASCGDGNDSRHDVVTDTTTSTSTTDNSHMTTSSDHNAMGSADSMNHSGTGSNAAGTTAGTGTPITDKATVDFTQKALSGGMMEIEMGNMAVNQATNPRVKSYGNMLVTDHTAAANELKSLATSNSISVPAAMMPEHKSHMDMLMSKKGSSFDKAYMDMMVKDHKKDIEDYRKASNTLNEAAYKAYATKTLPVLQKHLDSAQAISKSL